jgi:stringent starvation protein B
MPRSMNLVHSDKKRELLETLLEKGMVLVAVNGRFPGVDLPEHLRGDPQVNLNLSYRFGWPMEVGDWGVRATLTFGGRPYDCALPWPAIFLAVSHVSQERYLFPADVPDELLPGSPVAKEVEEEPPAERPRPRFAVVEGGAEEPEDEEEGSDGPRAFPSYLRRIK